MRAWHVMTVVISTWALCATPVRAVSNDDVDACQGSKVGSGADGIVAGCTAMIRSGDWSGSNLAAVYYNRGNAYFDQGKYAEAIHDFDAAVRLRAGYQAALKNRGLAKIKMGDVAGGHADLDAAGTSETSSPK
jgi:tetratricopeptide (TPR) repeat protein